MLGGVFFDLDETLIDAGGCHREASRRAFAAFGLDWEEALRRTGPLFGRRMREILAVRRDALGIAESAAPLSELLRLRQRAYVEVFPAGVRLLPGARQALASVREHGALAAIVSSSERAIITLTMEHFELSPLVSFVVGGDDVQNGKPDPECYELAYQRLQSFRPAEKRECLVVEDSPVGIAAARSAGLPVCLIPYSRPGELPTSDHSLTSLDEFPQLVARLSAG